MQTVYDFEVTTIDEEKQSLAAYRGNVLLVVNVASQCGFTSQYAGLEAMYRKYKDKGFALLGFPCDQFRHQEPGNEMQIKAFCQRTFDVTFPMFSKVVVNGPNAEPLYRYLQSVRRGLLGTKRIMWNFTKFLIDRQGNVVRRYSPLATPKRIER